MRFLLRCLGAVLGAAAGPVPVLTVFQLTHPRKGCMDGFDFIPWIPVALLSLLAGAAAGAWAAPGLVVLAGNGVLALVSYRPARRPGRRRRRRRRAGGKAAGYPAAPAQD